jgi:sterol desaturase/sphingolipid hydroxylase (fatty acid hydroxylase superfamily)
VETLTGSTDEETPAWLLALLAAALVFRLFFIFVGPFFIRPDEVFQALEPAHRLLTGRGVITWEWHEGIRSWLLPGVIAAIMQVSAWAGLGHSVLVVQCVFATLSLAVVAVAVRFGQAFAGRRGALFCGMLTAFWPDIVLDGSHTLSETQGGNLLAIGTMLAGIALRRRQVSVRAAFGIGSLLGLAAVVRFQLLPGVAVALVGMLLAGDGRRGAMALLGAALPVVGQAVLDAVTLGAPLQSMWKNVAVNLGQHRADLFGTMSPAFYLSQMVQFWGAALVPLAACFLVGFRRAILAGLVVVAVVFSHSLIAHKEFSFVAGAVPLILVVAGVGAASLFERAGPAVGARPSWVVLGMVAMCVTTTFSGYKALRRDHANLPLLMRGARQVPGLCGLALYVGEEQWWDWTGGYSLLDRDVPLYLLRRPADLAAAAPGFDALLADEALLATLPSSYVLSRCIHGACLLHRSGPCVRTRSHLMQDEAGLGLPIPPGSVRG